MVRTLLGFWSQSIRHSWPAYLIVISVFALGIITGTIGVKGLTGEQVQEITVIMEHFLQQAGALEIDHTEALGKILFNDIILILEIYLLSFTVIGIPLILGIIFTRGYVLGYCVAFMSNLKTIQGLALTCAALVPRNIILVPALLFGGVASLCFTLLLLKRFFNSKIIIWPSFVLYSGLMCLVLLVSASASLLEVYLTPLLVKITAVYLAMTVNLQF